MRTAICKTTLTLIFLAVSLQAYGKEIKTHTSSFNQTWLKALVSIEKIEKGKAPRPIGSGFLVKTPNNHLALVTAKHVVFKDKGKGEIKEGLAYRFNDKEGGSELITDKQATEFHNSGWIRSKASDVACRLAVSKTTSDFATIPQSLFLPIKQAEPGAPLFVIGFPMGMRSKEYATPIVRRAIVARVDPNNIIIDGFVFPGNSGGPVVYEPAVRLGRTFKSPILQGDWLVGMVSSFIPYRDVAISAQTKRPRIIFEENAGLCNVVPAEIILKLLQSPDFVEMDESLN
jgi:hypothetical protein